MGAGIGLKLPKIGKPEIRPEKLGKAIGGVVAPKVFPHAGSLYMRPFFSRRELGTADLRGLCVVIDGGAGLLVGYSGTLMLFVGIDPVRFAMQVTSPIMSLLLAQTEPNAMPVTRGLNAGIRQAVASPARSGPWLSARPGWTTATGPVADACAIFGSHRIEPHEGQRDPKPGRCAAARHAAAAT